MKNKTKISKSFIKNSNLRKNTGSVATEFISKALVYAGNITKKIKYL